MTGKLRARNFGLCAGCEVLDCQDTGLELVLAQDDDAAGYLVRGFKALLEPEAAIAQFGTEACAAQFACESEGGSVEVFAEWGDVSIHLFGLCALLRLQSEHQPVLAHRKTNAGSLGPANSLAQAVIPAAAEQSILRAKAAMRELKGGAGVVIEPPYKAVIARVRHASRIKRGNHGCEMLL